MPRRRRLILPALLLACAPVLAQQAPPRAPAQAPTPTPAQPQPEPAQPPTSPPAPLQPSQAAPAQPVPAQSPAQQSPAQQPPVQPSRAPQAAQPAKPAEDTVPLDEIRRFVSVFNAVRQAHVEPITDAQLMQSAIRGLLLDLDPHSVYFEREAAANFEEGARGAYEGVGVELQRQDDGSLKVIAAIDDTPAAKAGVKAGDLIVAIDGKPLRAGDSDSSSPLRGAAGSPVRLTILREGQSRPLDISVVRDTIRVTSVRSRLLEPGYGYVRIAAFQADTAADFERALETLQAGGKLRGLVIDLRSNPGGLLTAAVQIADDLLDAGGIVSTRGRLPITEAQFAATPGDRLAGAPVVVLVDAGSASASEVLAGALRDNGRARIVGSRTFGKGSVQTLLPLDNGDSIKLTTARYFTPKGTSIQALGIVPDVAFQPPKDDDVRPGFSEASLPGHLRAEGEDGLTAGDVLEGEAFVAQALAELKKLVR